MIEQLPDLPGTVVGVRATGRVTAEDYESVLMPAIERAIKEHGHIRLLYILDCNVTDFSLGAMWDDAKLGFSHLQDFERIAIVTDDHFVRNTLRAFHFAMPHFVGIFRAGEEEKAIAWLAA